MTPTETVLPTIDRRRHPVEPPRAGPLRRRAASGLRLTGSVVSLLFLAALWAGFAPPPLGGSTSYVVTYGISMLPRYHAGDLVLLRREPSYHVGEVAGYHNAQLHAVVMHEIIAIRNGHYIFKGINNDFVDSYEPTKSEIVGAEWIRLPGAGHILLDLRTPAVAAVGLALLWVLSFPVSHRTRRQRRRHHRAI